MISINQLRIGNILREGVVTNINQNGSDTVGFDNGGFLDIKDVSPKAINIEFMKDCGFSERGFLHGEPNSKVWMKSFSEPNIYIVRNERGLYVFFYVSSGHTKEYSPFVHELQNLYFALTGHELLEDKPLEAPYKPLDGGLKK